MNRRTVLVGAAGLVGLGVAGVAVNELFLPERETRVADSGVEGTPLKRGTFAGKTGHRVAGTVTLLRDADGYLLGFEDYEQTQGPDVFVYLTEAADPETTEEVEGAGLKVLIDGGADGGESTKTGTFSQRIPEEIDPDAYNGVSIWCDRFNVPFGAATLETV